MNKQDTSHDCKLESKGFCECAQKEVEEETTTEELMDDDSDKEEPQIDDFNFENHEPQN